MGYIAYRDKWDLLSSWWQLNYVLIDHPENWGNKWFPIWRSAYVSKGLSEKNTQLVVVITQKNNIFGPSGQPPPPKRRKKGDLYKLRLKVARATILGSRFFWLGSKVRILFVCANKGDLLGNLVDKSKKIWSWINVLWSKERKFEDIVLNVVQCGMFPTFCQYHSLQNTEICGATTTTSLFMLPKFWFINE